MLNQLANMTFLQLLLLTMLRRRAYTYYGICMGQHLLAVSATIVFTQNDFYMLYFNSFSYFYKLSRQYFYKLM